MIVTVNRPATVEVKVTVEVPVAPGLTVTRVGFRVAAVFVAVRATTPLKPFKLVRVREVLLVEPA